MRGRELEIFDMRGTTLGMMRGLALSVVLMGGAAWAQDVPAPAPASPANPPQQQDAAPVVRQEPAAKPDVAQPAQQAAPVERRDGDAQQDAEKKEKMDAQDADAPKRKAPKVAKADKNKPAKEEGNAVIWEDPGNVGGKDLFEGQGKGKHPEGPYTFLEEDKAGTNPKMEVKDAQGKKWKVKVGEEARPEVVASRLLWAVGYFANDDYFVPEAQVQGLKMSRSSPSFKGDRVLDARFARRPGSEKKLGIWKWKENQFMGTREFNGLRVMMAVMNGWDLKDENNAIYMDEKTGRQIYLASDVGATFGSNGRALTRARGKGNVGKYESSKFITKAGEKVDFATPAKPTATLIETMGFSAKDMANRSGMQWIGRDIPREDCKWIAGYLGQLTHQQLQDAFRAGGFSLKDVDEYVKVVEERIGELKAL